MSDLASAAAPFSPTASAAQETHNLGRIYEASVLYRDLLAACPPARASGEQTELILQFAPRLHVVPTEFFPLKDVVAVLHPERSVIGYHLFWEDDIDFPDDNTPCDHEIVWVEFDSVARTVTSVATYLHGARGEGPDAPEESKRHGGRPWIGVEWGKHGSIASGALKDSATLAVMQRNWEKLHTQGRRVPDHPLSQGWPVRFEGEFADYTHFSKEVDPVPLLREKRFLWVSAWPNAIINRCCLPYHFAPKLEWPWLLPPLTRRV